MGETGVTLQGDTVPPPEPPPDELELPASAWPPPFEPDELEPPLPPEELEPPIVMVPPDELAPAPPPDEPEPEVITGAPEELEPDEFVPVVVGDPDPPEPDEKAPEPAPPDPLGPRSAGPPLLELAPFIAVPLDPEELDPSAVPLEPEELDPLETGLTERGVPVSVELPHPATETASPQRIGNVLRRSMRFTPAVAGAPPKGS